MPYLQFPPSGDKYEQDIPIWLNFKVGNYSTFNRNRTRNFINGNNYGHIALPYPRQMATSNTQNYVAGASTNIQAIETGGNLGFVLGQQIIATKELFNSFLSGGNVVRFDHFETILEPGARRVHAYEFNLVAKNKGQAAAANAIALTFQTNVFPIANTDSILTMRHPPLWHIYATRLGGGFGSTEERSYWDGDPQICVLKSADINKSPILNTPFTTSDYKPLAVNIKLQFQELEPAMQRGDGTARLFSRAERISER